MTGTLINITPEIQQFIDLGALFVINHSGGKDSQCMTIELARHIPKHQLVIIHAHLPEVEWPGVKEHILKYANKIPVHFTQAKKTFFQMVEHRGKFPSPSTRQCTSDLKRGPIQKFINNYTRHTGFYTVVNCMGMRAEESPGRAKREVFRKREEYSCAHRQQYEWLPIHNYQTHEVFSTITLAGQYPHWAYSKGMTRLSCCFCIMSNENDINVAALHNPKLRDRYIETQKRLGFSLMIPKKGKSPNLNQLYQ